MGSGPLGGWALPLAAVALGHRLWADRRLLRGLTGAPVSWRSVLVTWPKDFMILALWVVGAFRRTVDWRGNVLVVGPGSRLSRPHTPESAAAGSPVTVASIEEAL